MNHYSKHHQDIVRSLNECILACEMCGSACLKEEDINPMAKCIRLTRECADICRLGVRLLSNESELSEIYIGLCADICSKCAEECEKHDHDHCKNCAEACRKCHQICKEYLDNRRQVEMNAL